MIRLLRDRKSISVQLFIFIFVAMIIAICIFFVLNAVGNKVIYTTLSGSKYIDKQNGYYAEELQEYVNDNNLKMTDKEELDKWAEKQKILYFEIYKDEQWIFSSSDDIKGREAPADRLYTKYWHNIKFSDGSAEVDFFGNYTYRFYYYALVIEFIICFVIFLAIILFAIRKTIRYIKQLNNEIEILEGGNLDYKITVEGCNELADLAQSLECMRNSLLGQIEKENELKRINSKIVNDMSHDIRTPLTTLMIYSEAIKHKKYKNEDELNQYINRIEDKAGQMKYLTDTLFEYSLKNDQKLNATITDDTFENVFFDVISGVIECLQQSGFSVKAEVQWYKINVSFFSKDIDRIINNIVSNLLKYADKSGPIEIKSEYNGKLAGISFQNGISQAAPENKGTNIGIANIKKMMTKVNGICEVADSEDSFKISLFFRIKETD